jgi:hypothetical protein
MSGPPLEQQLFEFWRQRMEGASEVLETGFEGRATLTSEETVSFFLELFGTARDADILLAREIDRLKT